MAVALESKNMSARQCKVGDRVITDWDASIFLITEHVITARRDDSFSQSRIEFQVSPPLRLLKADSWIDADWFEPLTKTA